MLKALEVTTATKQLSAGAGSPIKLLVRLILPDPYQPRKNFDPILYAETRESIRSIGQQVAIVVNPAFIKNGEQYYYIKFGENRWRIHKDLGLLKIDSLIDEKPYDCIFDILRVIRQAAENINRIGHTHGEITTVYRLYYESEKGKDIHKHTGEIKTEFARLFGGKSQAWVENYAAMANLKQEFLDRVDIKGEDQLPFMAAVALGRNPKENQEEVLDEAEVLADGRKDKLYLCIVHGSRQMREKNGGKSHSRAVDNKRSFMKIVPKLHVALDQFGGGRSKADRDSHTKEVIQKMSSKEIEEMTSGLVGVTEKIESLIGLLKVKGVVPDEESLAKVFSTPEPINFQKPLPAVTDDVKDLPVETTAEIPAIVFKLKPYDDWPGNTGDITKAKPLPNEKWTSRTIKGTKY